MRLDFVVSDPARIDPSWLEAQEALTPPAPAWQRHGSPAQMARVWELINKYNGVSQDRAVTMCAEVLGRGGMATVVADDDTYAVKIGMTGDGWADFAKASMDDPHEQVLKVYAMHLNYKTHQCVAVMKRYHRTLIGNPDMAYDMELAIRDGCLGARNMGVYNSLSRWFQMHFGDHRWFECLDLHANNFLYSAGEPAVISDPFAHRPAHYPNLRAGHNVTVE